MKTVFGGITVGEWTFWALNEAELYMDGGASFGVVPKVLWSRERPADEKNRIKMVTRCLLLKGKNRVILLDTGVGNKFGEKSVEIYSIRSSGGFSKLLKNCGVKLEDITDVILSHLHFDHAGGATELAANNKIKPVFPNAVYYVSEKQYNWAVSPSIRDRASYIAENYIPLKKEGRLQFVRDGDTIGSLVDVFLSDGHTPGMICCSINFGDIAVLLPFDLLPTYSHVPLTYGAAFDIYPLKVIEEKLSLYKRAVALDAWIFLGHDPDAVFIKIEESGGKFHVVKKGDVEIIL